MKVQYMLKRAANASEDGGPHGAAFSPCCHKRTRYPVYDDR